MIQTERYGTSMRCSPYWCITKVQKATNGNNLTGNHMLNLYKFCQICRWSSSERESGEIIPVRANSKEDLVFVRTPSYGYAEMTQLAGLQSTKHHSAGQKRQMPAMMVVQYMHNSGKASCCLDYVYASSIGNW